MIFYTGTFHCCSEPIYKMHGLFILACFYCHNLIEIMCFYLVATEFLRIIFLASDQYIFLSSSTSLYQCLPVKRRHLKYLFMRLCSSDSLFTLVLIVVIRQQSIQKLCLFYAITLHTLLLWNNIGSLWAGPPPWLIALYAISTHDNW